MGAKDAMYKARFCHLEAMMQLRSASEVTRHKDVPITASLARLMVR
jgi:hypothetical protein